MHTADEQTSRYKSSCHYNSQLIFLELAVNRLTRALFRLTVVLVCSLQCRTPKIMISNLRSFLGKWQTFEKTFPLPGYNLLRL